MHDEEDVATLYVGVPAAEPEVVRGPRVVAGVDGSAGSRAALRFALEDAARRGVPVEAVVACRGPELWEDVDGRAMPEQQRLGEDLRRQCEGSTRAVVEEVAGEVDGPVPDVLVRAAVGSAADVLIRESQGADLLVVGSRGHGRFHTVLLGSTSMQCAMHATCPVTVVHSPEAHGHRWRLHRERSAARQPDGAAPDGQEAPGAAAPR